MKLVMQYASQGKIGENLCKYKYFSIIFNNNNIMDIRRLSLSGLFPLIKKNKYFF